MNAITENINKMIATGNRLDLPQDEMFANYAAVKTALVKAGGKYKKNGFEFTTDAAEIQARICGGEKIDDKKKFQAFDTPEALAQRMVDMADVYSGDKVLEPSGGIGRIVIPALATGASVDTIEIDDVKFNILNKLPSPCIASCADFMDMAPENSGRYNAIIMNPPFTKGQDIKHVMHAYRFLERGGRLIAIMSESPFFRDDKKSSAFRFWLEEVGGESDRLDAGEFKSSGTMVSTRLVKIIK